MREARTILELWRERGKKRLPVERMYRLLYSPDLFLMSRPMVAFTAIKVL